MKLNKILTVLAPITVVGTIVPTVVSCNTDTMTINFGDSINCKDKENKDPAYHSLETVQNTIKKCVNIEESDSINVNNINAQIKLGNTKIIQNVYYDLIASLTILNGFEILLTSYTSNFANSQLTVTFNLNGNQQNWEDVEYSVNDDGKICFGYGDNKYQSYTYKDCTPAE